MLLTNKIALVTGAYRGIGAAIALELAKAGATIAACDINADFAAEITKSYQEQGINGRGFCMDVTKPDSIETALTEIAKIYGAPQILVNNAGITRDNLILRMKDEEWQQVITTNLTSVFYLLRQCLPSMIKARYGRIINIASVVGITGNAGQANYTAAKAGVIALTKSTAKEVGSRGVTVNAIAPGFIESAMTQKLSPENRERMLKTIPLGHVGQPADIAKAVVFLASDYASYITGETLNVNGGMAMI